MEELTSSVYSSKLLQEIAGEEGYDSVLGRNNLVRGIDMFFLDPLLFVVVVVRQLLVEVDGAWGADGSFTREDLLDVKRGDLVATESNAGLAL